FQVFSVCSNRAGLRYRSMRARCARFRLLSDQACRPSHGPILREGDIVRVEHGPLRGIECHVDMAAAQLVVFITLLQRSVAVKLPREWVAPRALARTAER